LLANLQSIPAVNLPDQVTIMLLSWASHLSVVAVERVLRVFKRRHMVGLLAVVLPAGNAAAPGVWLCALGLRLTPLIPPWMQPARCK
jgi:hypothetical protein